MQPIIRSIVYVSRAIKHFSLNELSQLMAHARSLNIAEDISGVLFYHDGIFLQLLEGAPQAVQTLMTRIRADSRHEAVLILVDSQHAHAKLFPDWKMGFYHLSSIERVIGPALIENDTQALDAALTAAAPDNAAANLLATFWQANRQHVNRSRKP
jgi:hypothetical protein